MARRLRIVTGLILFLFVTTHLVTVSFGLVSIAMMDRVDAVLMAAWKTTVGSTVVTVALTVHFALGMLAIYRLNTLRMTQTDAVQMATNLAIVPLLVPHVVGTAVAARFGIDPSYESLVPYFWIDVPAEGLRQVVLLTCIWVHGAIGFYTFMRIQPWWRRVAGFVYPLAVAIPVLALLGFVDAGNEAIERRENPPVEATETPAAAPVEDPAMSVEQPSEQASDQLPFDEIIAILSRINWTVIYVYMIVLAAVFGARQARLVGERRRVRVAFVDGPEIEADTKLTLLETARIKHVSVANLCRGRGRCGTCRVRIVSQDAELAPPSVQEAATLARVQAGPDERLSCQIKPVEGLMVVERVLPPYIRGADIARHYPAPQEDGVEAAAAPSASEAA